MFALDAASAALGIELVEAAEGHAVARMTVTPAMVNGHDIAHGGYVFLLADTAFACACNSHGPVTVAAAAEITFVAAAGLSDQLVATASERTRFGRSGIYDVTVHREPGHAAGEMPDQPGGELRSRETPSREVVAEFRGHSRTLRSE